MKRIPPSPSEKIYVSFLPTNITETEVRSMFAKFGPINLFLLRQRIDGFTYAHITYQTVEQAWQAITVMNKMELEDKVLRVSFSADNCVPKRKNLQQQKQSPDVLEPQKTIEEIETKASKKTIKRQKQRERAKLRKQLETDPNPLEYLERIESALKDVLKLKELYLDLKKNEIPQKKEDPKPEEQKKPTNDAKVSIADLNVFKSWLKCKDELGKKVDEGEDTDWDEVAELGEVEKSAIKK